MTDSPAEKKPSTGTKVLKWIGIATAVISLVLGGNQVLKLVNEKRKALAQQEKAMVLVKTAKGQVGSNDYNGAWKTLERANELTPDNRYVANAQADIAMQWIRSILFEVTGPEKTFSEVVDRLTPLLNNELGNAESERAADLLAHIGWANFLKWYDNITGLKTDELFEQAIEKDSLNVYAHCFLAFSVVKHDHEIDKAKMHFEKALKSGREKQLVRKLQLSAFSVDHNEALELEKILVINDMRKNGETLNTSQREQIAGRSYNTFNQPLVDSLNAQLSATEHLALYEYLISGTDYVTHPYLVLTHAVLLENTGNKTKALQEYKKLEDETYFTKHEAVKEGVRRCSK